MTSKAQAMIEKISKEDYSKIKNFCAINETIKKVKNNQKNGRKGLVARINKALLQLNNT